MQALEKITYSNNWITILLMLLFVSIVLLKLIDAKKLKESFFAILNFTLIEEDLEGNGFFDVFQILIFIFSVTTISLLAYNIKLYYSSENSGNLTSFLTFFVGLLFYFLTKRIFEYALSLLFLIKNSLQFFIISKTNYLYSISFMLYIAMILCEYANINQVYIFCFAAFLFITRFVFILARNKKLIFNKLFYFILYICAFEIAPLFVLFKLMF